jgi:hypothetical protein
MNTLASLATNNGNLAGYTYGATPNDPVTWDAFMVQGCLCDEGFTGYDCSLLTCPTGDDPVTSNQSDEQQLVSCTDADGLGLFRLSFRQASTIELPANATLDIIQNALESLSTVGTISIDTYSNLSGDGAVQLCTPSGNQFVITFLSVHGPLPLLQITSSNIDSLTVSELVAGTKENIQCSGRGLCDPTTGACDCFTGYGSSDGMGNKGSLGDCGYIEPVYLNVIS